MKKYILIMTALASCAAKANSLDLTHNNSGAGDALVYSGAPQTAIRIIGDAARVLYLSLEVQAEGSFGFVQTQTKKTASVECVQAIMGDVPGRMTESSYTCTILVEKK